MKKIALVVAVAALVGATSTCFAGFGLPSVPGVTSSSSEQSAPVDLTDLTAKQENMIKYTAAGLLNAAEGVIGVQNVLNQDATKIVAARSALEQEINADNCKKLSNLLDKQPVKKDAIDKILKGTDEQKAQLKEALSKAETLKLASYISLGVAAVNSVQSLKEATDALKGTKDLSSINKIKGLINSFKVAGEMLPSVQKVFKAYDSNVASAKEALGVQQPSEEDVQNQAKETQDGLGVEGLE